jgi:glycosyltransferase involved in cell wall biosynthesis
MLRSIGVPDSRIAVIPHGVPAHPAPTGDSTRYGLFAGRLSREKGVRTLLDAAAEAPDVRVAVAGGGPLAEVVRDSPVQYLGHLEGRALDEALASAAFTVIPSECQEMLSYSALESFSVGKPVVATSVGGLPEVVINEETGLLVPPGSARLLADAMRKLWRDPSLTAQLGANALRAAAERFSLDLQTQRMVELYAGLVERRPNAAESRSGGE